MQCVQRGLRCYELNDVCIRQGVTEDWASGHMHGIISQHMKVVSDRTIIFRAGKSGVCWHSPAAGCGWVTEQACTHTLHSHISPWFAFLKIFGMNSKFCQGRPLRRPMVFNNEPEAIIRQCFLLVFTQFVFLRQL